jgi:hypothetical protein
MATQHAPSDAYSSESARNGFVRVVILVVFMLTLTNQLDNCHTTV